jgi:hypothetical protein
MNIDDRAVREHVLYLLRGGGAHEPIGKILADVPVAVRGERPRGLSHSPWEILEHLRITQWDILEYARDPAHVSPEWPKGYWPETSQPPDDHAWKKSLDAFTTGLQAMQQLVADPSVDLVTPIAHGQEGHTVLREALLVADHNAYHGAEMVTVRRLLKAW